MPDSKSSKVTHISVVPELRRLRQEDCQFQASLGFMVRSLTQKNKTKKPQKATTVNHPRAHVVLLIGINKYVGK
jgi:hypothetical protein